ncbi:MAG: type IV pilus assembly protein PilM [Candidatus Omnitrophota bacterium]|jgi:type IV pilus assembly protein PilM
MKTKKQYSRIGLDIGDSAIKLAELGFSKDRVELAGFALKPIAQGQEPELKEVISSPQAVNISISGASTVVRYIYFPRMSRDELRQSLKFEVQKYIPFPINEVNLDCHILREDAADNKMLVLVAAAKKEAVKQHLKLMQDAGIKVGIVDLDTLALINAFTFNYSGEDGPGIKDKTVALLNIGASTSNISILESFIPVLSRDIYIAGNAFVQQVKDVESANKPAAATEHMLSDFAKEIRVSFDFYESQNSFTVTKIFLSGGGSRLPSLKDMLAGLLGIEVEYWDPLKRIKIADGVDAAQARELSGQLAVAVGLALRK